MPDAASDEARNVEQPKTIVTDRRLKVNSKASAAWMRRLSRHAVLCATARRQFGNHLKLGEPRDRFGFKVGHCTTYRTGNVVNVFAPIEFLIVQPTSVGYTGRPVSVVIWRCRHAVSDRDGIRSHFLEEENIANRVTITNEIRRCSPLSKAMRSDAVGEGANDRAFHLGKRPSIRQWQRQHAAAERELNRVLLKFFAEQNKRIIAGVNHSAAPSLISQYFRPADERDSFLEAIAEPFIGFMATGAIDVLNSRPASPKTAKQINVDLDDFESPERVKDAIRNSFDELIEQDYWLNIQQGIADFLTDELESALIEGTTIRDLTKQLKESLGEGSKVRAAAIARTETTLAFNSGHESSYAYLVEGGLIDGKKRLAVIDDDTRETHSAIDGTQVDATGNFEIGGVSVPFPGHWLLPAKERVNCRCTTAGVFG